MLCHEVENTLLKFDFAKERASAPADLQPILDDVESIAYRRKDHERHAMLMKMCQSAGYSELALGPRRYVR